MFDKEKVAELRRLDEVAGKDWHLGLKPSLFNAIFDANGEHVGEMTYRESTSDESVANRRIAVAARNALPSLLDELERLQNENARLKLIAEAARKLNDAFENDPLVCDVRRAMSGHQERALDALAAALKD